MAYLRGLGDLPLCSSLTMPPGFVGPVDCDNSQGPVNYPASQSQLANLAMHVQELMDQPAAPQPQTLTEWVNKNAMNLALGFGVFALVWGMAKR